MGLTMKKRRSFIPLEWSIVLTLLIIPSWATVLFAYPVYYEFEAPGKTVPVSEIGVNGTVRYTYVNGNVTGNLFEKWLVPIIYGPEIEFYSVPKDYYDTYDEMYLEIVTKEDTMENALQVVTDVSGATDGLTFDRLEKLMAETEDLYGDSIGLMLAIGLYEEATGKDFSRGGRYKIAGTGTMEGDKSVGSVGAIKHKLLTADKDGIDLFLLPSDKDEWGERSNEIVAEQVSKDLALDMDIVPVKTLNEAIAYLESLP